MEDSLVNRGKESLLIPEQTPALAAYFWEVWILLVTLLSLNWIQVVKMLIGLHFQSCLGIMVLERVVGQVFASVQLNRPWQLWHAVSAKVLMFMTKIFICGPYARFIQSLFNGSGSSILAVTEGCQLTLWDLRVKEKGGCVQRICGSLGDILYAVCNSSTGNVAVGGADRTVTVYDPRRWSAVSRWVHCSKYEVTGLAFSSLDPDYIYIQGVDYEVICGSWMESKREFSFRGDSNWLGFSKCYDMDVLGGWCDSGSIFVADIDKGSKIHMVDDIVNGSSS